jgi:predicted ATPase/DNA-binding CsgD family transcriptional regulator
VNGVARAEVLVNLGREDQLDVAALRGLVASIDRYLTSESPARLPEDADVARAHPNGGGGSGPVGAPPASLDRFVGRDRELADLRTLLTRGRLVTLTGPAGVGKTRMATELLRRAGAGSYPGGVWWVDLAPLPTNAPIESTVAAALSAHEQPKRQIRDGIVEACGRTAALMVLDNCEHVVDGCAAFLPWLLQACPRLRVVATSRTGIRIQGETLFPVAPLAVPATLSADTQGVSGGVEDVRLVDSVRLFTDRASAAAPNLEWTDNLLLLASQVCLRLDGLPLAIELAARQASVLPLPELLERLDDRFALLTGGTRGAPQRHQSLRAAIGWSYDLLDPLEQATFRRLAVLPGGFDAQTAAGVCADLGLGSDKLWALLRRLTDKSLLVADTADEQAGRFRILESLRAFGRDRLAAAAELVDTHDRLLAWLAELTTPLLTDLALTVDAHSRLHRELHNLSYAVEIASATNDHRYPLLAVSLTRILRLRGGLHRARALIDDVVAHHRTASPIRALALNEFVEVLCDSGEPLTAKPYATESLELAQQLKHQVLTVKALRLLAFVCHDLGEVSAAVALHEQTGDILRPLGERAALAETLNGLAYTLAIGGQLAAAAQAVDEAWAHLEVLNAGAAMATAHTAATVALLLGNLDQASAYFTIPLSTPVWDARSVPYNLDGLAMVAARNHQPQRALRLLSAASAAMASTGLVVDPGWQNQCDQATTLACEQLTEPQVAAATAEGADLDAEQAIAYALRDQWPPTSRRDGTSVLTRREQSVAELVAQGLTNLQIAGRLGISTGTVAAHLKHIRAKLDLPTRAHVTAWITRRHVDAARSG